MSKNVLELIICYGIMKQMKQNSHIKMNAGEIVLNSSNKLQGERVVEYRKTIADLVHCFLDTQQAIQEAETLAYTVFAVDSKDPENEYRYSITKLEPIFINDECNMTRGHYHQDRKYGEVYLGLEGEGLLLSWDGINEPFLERVYPNSVHLIDGKNAHRLINTGDRVLSVGAIYSVHAGNEYNEIEKHPFPVRVFKRNGTVEFVFNNQ